jgi:hypothetical protein
LKVKPPSKGAAAVPRFRFKVGQLLFVLAVVTAFPAIAQAAGPSPFLSRFSTVDMLGSTVPLNGDVNPYGIAVVPTTTGNLVAGDIIVSNFNASSNIQGTGTTIVEMTPSGSQNLFAGIDPTTAPASNCPGGIGLTTALVALSNGDVIVGSLPTTGGMSSGSGCLLVLDSTGNVVDTISGGTLNGPWDMTAADAGNSVTLFVTNVLNGTAAANGSVVAGGTVSRLRLEFADGSSVPTVVSDQVIADGFGERTDPNALVVGPTGVALSRGTLYVADTVGDRIAAISNPLGRKTTVHNAGTTVASGPPLNGPLGLTRVPGGDLVAANAADGNLVEVSPAGNVVDTKTVETAFGAGSLFGLTPAGGDGLYFVDDGFNTLSLLH